MLLSFSHVPTLHSFLSFPLSFAFIMFSMHIAPSNQCLMCVAPRQDICFVMGCAALWQCHRRGVLVCEPEHPHPTPSLPPFIARWVILLDLKFLLHSFLDSPCLLIPSVKKPRH